MLDTNVWLDLALFEDPALETLRQAIVRGELRVVASQRMRDELADVVARPLVLAQAAAARGRRGSGQPSPREALANFDRHSLIVPPGAPCGLACRDADDQIFLDLAITQRARWLFSKDKALLALARVARRRHGLTIATAARAPGTPL